jgi:NAD+ kinase
LSCHHAFCEVDEADIIVVLGGDGFMLSCLHRYLNLGKPIYGMNRGTVGFLMNEYQEDGLAERLADAETVRIHPLRMRAETTVGDFSEALAFNQIALNRMDNQAANLEVRIDGKVRLDRLVADGVLVSTPAGSSAYNFSAHGPIIPIGTPLLALTPISPFRPRRWRGALLPGAAIVEMRVLDPDKRPVRASADSAAVEGVSRVEVAEDRAVSVAMLFDPGHSLEERVIREQFTG